MPTFVYMTRCDGCGHCVDICPSDIMHIDTTYRRAYNIEPNFCWECYSCVKACPQHAIDVRGYADFAPLGIRVNCIAPGLIKTDFAKALWDNPDTLVHTLRNSPLGRIGEPVDIAGAAILLASDAGRFITGTTIVIDGGVTIAGRV